VIHQWLSGFDIFNARMNLHVRVLF
jgi:hypothetical protein